MTILKTMVEAAVVDGLVRVDLLQCRDGRLVVNEFESLEARFNSGKVQDEMEMAALLQIYWYRKLSNCLSPIYLK